MSDLIRLLSETSASLTLEHALGLADAPDDPVGAQALFVTGAGGLRLEWQHRGQSGVWTADVEPAVVGRLFSLLVEGGFPDVEWVGFPPGPSFRSVAVHHGDEELDRVFLARRHYERTEPWQELFRIVDSLVVQVRGPLPGYVDVLDPAVNGVRRVR